MMAKTSKNKIKMWRRKARGINVEEGRRHRGRMFKNLYQIPALPTGLLLNLLKSIGIESEKHDAKPLTTDDVTTEEQLPALS
jgi:hypothetical protein